jgi:hypothetical protein
LETSFFLIALHRYPHALVVCTAAIESAMQAADIGAKERDGLQELIRKARQRSQRVSDFADDGLIELRLIRNRITHRGFSLRDDSNSADLYLGVALPYLALCFAEFHSFDLIDGLFLEFSNHINVARKVHTLAKKSLGIDMSYCLNSFGHLVRLCHKENFSTGWELRTLDHGEATGVVFGHVEEEKNSLERLFDASWTFNCPVCGDLDSAVAELDSYRLHEREVIPQRMACAKCGFVVRPLQPFLSQMLLEGQVIMAKGQILKEYGIG